MSSFQRRFIRIEGVRANECVLLRLSLYLWGVQQYGGGHVLVLLAQVRGCSYMFGYHAVQRFLRENRLMYMVRAHEVQELGFRSHFPRYIHVLYLGRDAAWQLLSIFLTGVSRSGSAWNGDPSIESSPPVRKAGFEYVRCWGRKAACCQTRLLGYVAMSRRKVDRLQPDD